MKKLNFLEALELVRKDKDIRTKPYGSEFKLIISENKPKLIWVHPKDGDFIDWGSPSLDVILSDWYVVPRPPKKVNFLEAITYAQEGKRVVPASKPNDKLWVGTYGDMLLDDGIVFKDLTTSDVKSGWLVYDE